MIRPALALIGAAARGAALFLAGYAAALLDGRPRKSDGWSSKSRQLWRDWGADSANAPLRWSDTGEAVETYQTFTLPALRAVN